MPKSRRKDLRNALLGACFIASSLGSVAVIAFFVGAFDVTVAHVKAILLPTVLMLCMDAYLQFRGNERLLKNLFQWLDEKENSDLNPSMDLAGKAQEEMIKFPFSGSLLSICLWSVSGLIICLWAALTSDVFPARQLLLIFIAVAEGGLVSAIFQFYFYKILFRRKCGDLFAVLTDFAIHSKNTRLVSYSTKLLVTFVVLLIVGLTYAAIMGNNRAAGVLIEGEAQLMKPIAIHVENMRRQQNDTNTINQYLGQVSSYLSGDVFIFDKEGNILYGNAPKDITPDIIKQFVDEFDSVFTKIMRWGSYFKTRNLPDSNDLLVWIPTESNLYIGSVFRWKMAESVLGRFNRVFIVLVFLFLIVAVWITRLAANDVSGPLRKVAGFTEEIATGDLSIETALLSEDEVAELGSSLTAMVNGLRGLVARVGRAAEQVDEASESIGLSQGEVSEGTFKQARIVEDSTLVAGAMGQVVSDISENVDVMAANAQESAKVIMDMEVISKEVSDNIDELSVSVESTASAIYEMNATINEIHESVEALSGASEETAASMLEMDRAIKEVEERSKQTLNLSENVTTNARDGVTSVQSTIKGIGRVEEGVREATEVINNLGNLAEKIGDIIAVINDIADQTNLLALNAAIIAAQAGERGRGFAVVADEIKKLSERTTLSTKEIRELIGSVQAQSQKAVSLMDRESQNVEDGVNLAFQAGQALEKIQHSAEQSGDMVRMIAKATAEQAANSRRVTTAVESIAERVAQIASAIHDQTRGAEQITKAAGEMKEIAPMVRMKAQKQVDSGKQVTMAMENIREMVDYVQKSQERQREQAGKIVTSMDQIKVVCQISVDAVARLDNTVKALSQQSVMLKEELKRFVLPHEATDLSFE